MTRRFMSRGRKKRKLKNRLLLLLIRVNCILIEVGIILGVSLHLPIRTSMWRKNVAKVHCSRKNQSPIWGRSMPVLTPIPMQMGFLTRVLCFSKHNHCRGNRSTIENDNVLHLFCYHNFCTCRKWMMIWI